MKAFMQLVLLFVSKYIVHILCTSTLCGAHKLQVKALFTVQLRPKSLNGDQPFKIAIKNIFFLS